MVGLADVLCHVVTGTPAPEIRPKYHSNDCWLTCQLPSRARLRLDLTVEVPKPWRATESTYATPSQLHQHPLESQDSRGIGVCWPSQPDLLVDSVCEEERGYLQGVSARTVTTSDLTDWGTDSRSRFVTLCDNKAHRDSAAVTLHASMAC